LRPKARSREQHVSPRLADVHRSDQRLARGERFTLSLTIRETTGNEDEDVLRQSVYGVRNRLGRVNP